MSEYVRGPSRARKHPRLETKPTTQYTDRRHDTGGGYERVRSTERRAHTPGDRREDVYVPVHRLCAVAWCYGPDWSVEEILADLAGSDVHHTSGVEWDNREDCLTVMAHDRHASLTNSDRRAIAESSKRQVEAARQRGLDEAECAACGAVTDTLATSPGFEGERCLDCATRDADGAEIRLNS